MSTIKPTITLGGKDEDEPSVSLLEGHVSVEDFNKAFIAEGWKGEPWPEDCISHEWWIHHKDGSWECSNKSEEGSVPVTVATWEWAHEMPPINPNADPSLH